MSFALSLMIGRIDFDADPWIQPLEIEQVVSMLADFADRESDGSLLLPARCASRDGRITGLGWCDGIPIELSREGFVRVTISYRSPRLDRFLARMIERLGCVAYGHDNGWMTEAILRRANSSGPSEDRLTGQ